MKRVEVLWVDSISDGGWADREDAIRRSGMEGVMETRSVGFLLAEEDGYVVLVSSYMREGDLVQGVLQIPRRSITDVIALSRPENDRG